MRAPQLSRINNNIMSSTSSSSALPNQQQSDDDDDMIAPNLTASTSSSSNSNHSNSNAKPKSSSMKLSIVSKWRRNKQNNNSMLQHELYPVEYNRDGPTSGSTNATGGGRRKKKRSSTHEESNSTNNNITAGACDNGILHELLHWYTNRSWKKKLLTVLVFVSSALVICDLFVFEGGYVEGWIDGFLQWVGEHHLWGVWGYIVVLGLTSCE